MNGRPWLRLIACFTVGLAAIPLQTHELSGQEVSDRFRVMVVEIQPQDNADKKFGEKLAEELRDLINDMERNQPIGDRDLKRALREYDVEMEDMNCVRAVQLAPLIDAQVVFCGGYTQVGTNYVVEAKYISQGGEEFIVDPVTVPEKDGHKQADAYFRIHAEGKWDDESNGHNRAEPWNDANNNPD